MKLILSRKGFDAGSGGGASPILNDRPVPMPIPTGYRSETRYCDLNIGQLVEQITDGCFRAETPCHYDPMFERGRCAFGQIGASQSHLKNQGVGLGDLFLFWGLYQPFPLNGSKKAGRHHRIFGFLKIEEVRKIGNRPTPDDQPEGFTHRHPHTSGVWPDNNTLYLGSGAVAGKADNLFRLTQPNEKRPSMWRVPAWLKAGKLTYHNDPRSLAAVPRRSRIHAVACRAPRPGVRLRSGSAR